MNNINNLVELINALCECKVVSVDESGINVDDGYDENGYDENGYVIICDDEDDTYNTLMAMYDGMSLLANIMERRGGR